jgi:hypothetical protein
VRRAALALAAAALAVPALAQSDVAALARKSLFALTPAERAQVNAAADAEQAREMRVLGITKLRPGRDGANMAAPNAVNYDESKATPFDPGPSTVAVLDNGSPVSSAADWWSKRRPQIVAAFERDVYGRVPADVPKVTWRVVATRHETIGGVKAVTRVLDGHVDNRAAPSISVDIDASLTLPEGVTGRVPVIINLAFTHLPKDFRMPDAPPGPDWKTQILSKGWGYAILDPATVQPDTGAGLNEGIIGLTNRGKPRTMDQWGALRAWAWGASRLLDYLEADPHVAGSSVGVAGHSRYGKAALVAEAFDRRFAIGYISSSGAGGAKLLTRNYGEALENLTAASEFHWFAGRFMRYGADPLSVRDLPVDADALIALCAPRPVFISAGTQQAGDGWVDARGSFIAARRASVAWTLLGYKGLTENDFPQTGTLIDGGRIAFRQHHYGHTQAPNWRYFLAFADRYLPVQPGG